MPKNLVTAHPLTAALIVAGVLAGAHAGIAAISESLETNGQPVAAQSELPPATDTHATDTVAAASDALTPGAADATAAQVPVETSASVKSVPAMERVATRASDDEYYVRIPFTNKTIKVTNPTFPHNSNEFADPSPSVVTYFDQKNGNTQLAGAASPVFPSGSDEWRPDPRVIAYFDRLDATNQLAALKAQQAAAAAMAQQTATPAAPATSTAAVDNTATAATPGG